MKRLFIIAGTLILIGLISYGSWYYFTQKKTTQTLEYTNLKPDIARAREFTVQPDQNTVLQINDRERVVMTLEIPAGALDTAQQVKLIPFFFQPDKSMPTAGALISPGNINFKKPVTLSFDLAYSPHRTNAEKTLTTQAALTGASQVLMYDGKKKELVQTLVDRTNETQTYLPARILTGGSYVFSLDGAFQKDFAHASLAKDKAHVLTLLESASVLAEKKKLTNTEKERARKAVDKILAKENPPLIEFAAAATLDRRLQGKKVSGVETAYAGNVVLQYVALQCKQKLSITDYVAAAKTAQLYGDNALSEECMTAARNLVAEEARAVLQSTSVGLKDVIRMRARVQAFGIDEFDGPLETKMLEIARKYVESVLNDPNATPQDILGAMQQAQLVGLEQSLSDQLQSKLTTKAETDARATLNNPNASAGELARAKQALELLGGDQSLQNELGERLTTAVENMDPRSVANDPNASAADLNEALKKAKASGDASLASELEKDLADKTKKDREESEAKKERLHEGSDEEAASELLIPFDWRSIGLIIAQQMFGLEDLSEEGVKAWTDKLVEQGHELREFAGEICQMTDAIGGNCDESLLTQMDEAISELQTEGYRAAGEIGEIEARDFEDPDLEPGSDGTEPDDNEMQGQVCEDNEHIEDSECVPNSEEGSDDAEEEIDTSEEDTSNDPLDSASTNPEEE